MTASRPLLLGGGDIPGVAWPALHSDKIAPLAAHIHQLEATQWLPREEIDAGQQVQLAAIVSYFVKQLPLFAARLAGHGLTAADLLTRGGFAALTPITRRDAIRDFERAPEHVLPAGHGSAGAVRTTGSTGEPVTIWKTAVTNLDWLALTLRYHRWAEPDFSARLASVRAYTMPTGEFPDWGTPIAHFYETGPRLSLNLATDVEKQVDRLIDYRPNSLIVYPSNLAALIAAFERRGARIESLRRIRTVGETLSPGLRAEASVKWGVEVHDCYSSEEVGYIAVQCPDSELYHVMDETLIVEILDDAGNPCAAGETGRVVVTDLRNHATPLIRYAIGDYATRGERCPCGRGLSTIARIAGRERNMLRNPDGTVQWPMTGVLSFRDIAPVLQGQMVQHSLDEIEMRLVTERPLTEAEEESLRRLLIETRLKNQPFRVSFSYHTGSLPKGPTGKFEEFVSMIATS